MVAAAANEAVEEDIEVLRYMSWDIIFLPHTSVTYFCILRVLYSR